ncbi:MAG: hypothetical protein KDA91_20545 [Planctomycetaceae bacterium]|nr:hypothetical protein [Planctomycetaceae bacterium]
MDREAIIREIQERFAQHENLLNERERRFYAAREAMRLGRGGIALVSKALRMSPNTIKRGMIEIANPSPEDAGAPPRIRKPGGGRKPGQQ